MLHVDKDYTQGRFFIIVTKFNIFKFVTIHQKTEKINTMRGNGYRYLI